MSVRVGECWGLQLNGSLTGRAPDDGGVERNFVKILSGLGLDEKGREGCSPARLLFCPAAAAFHTALGVG